MNKLIWKELREMRLIPVALASLVVVVLIVCSAVSTWMAVHGIPSSAWMQPADRGLVLIFGLAAVGIFAGSGAIASETGSRTLDFLTSLPISRPRLWTAKVISGAVIVASSATTTALAYCITSYCMFSSRQPVAQALDIRAAISSPSLTDTASGWISASDLHAAMIAILIAVFSYCLSLLVSTLVDRMVTAAVVSSIASVPAGFGLIYLVNLLDVHHDFISHATEFDKHDPNSAEAILAAYLCVIVGLLTASFAAFWQGDSLRTRRRLAIAGVTILSWLAASTVGFAAYGHTWRAKWERIYTAKYLEWTANQAELNRITVRVAAPTVHGQHWTVFIDHACVGSNETWGSANIILGADDLDKAGAIPEKAEGGTEISARCWSVPGSLRGYGPGWLQHFFFRGSPKVALLPVTSQQHATGRRIAARHPIKMIALYYMPEPPIGHDHQVVRLYDKRGSLVGVIDVYANKEMFVDHCKAAPGGACL